MKRRVCLPPIFLFLSVFALAQTVMPVDAATAVILDDAVVGATTNLVGSTCGDLDGDGDIDLGDHAMIAPLTGTGCLTGPHEPSHPPLPVVCAPGDCDGDDDVDLHDVASMQRAFSDCSDDASCQDGLFCNGVERCVAGMCEAGAGPCAPPSSCDEAQNACVQCFVSSDCAAGELCVNGTCIPDIVGNDHCGNAAAVVEGTTPFTTTGATTDGPDEPDDCSFFGYTHIESDIWYCYSATCDGLATIGLCGSSFDTKLAVYRGCACPAEDPIACSDDNCGLSTESRITFTAEQGVDYLIRIGGYEGAQGNGLLTIYCGDTPSCGQGQGDCFVGHAEPTCDNQECCDAVCQIDQYCCDVAWDDYCAGEAEGICGGVFPACVDGSGDCESAHSGQGCDHEACCQMVCMSDPFCCLITWDAMCAQAAGDRCSILDVCVGGTGSCFAPHRDPGCDDAACCETVCMIDPFCCTTEWDETCVSYAMNECRPTP